MDDHTCSRSSASEEVCGFCWRELPLSGKVGALQELREKIFLHLPTAPVIYGCIYTYPKICVKKPGTIMEETIVTKKILGMGEVRVTSNDCMFPVYSAW